MIHNNLIANCVIYVQVIVLSNPMRDESPPVRHIKIMNNNGIVNGLSAPKAKMENFRPNRTPNSRSSSIEWNRTECLWLLDFIMRYSSQASKRVELEILQSIRKIPSSPHTSSDFVFYPGVVNWLAPLGHLGSGLRVVEGYNNLETPTRKKECFFRWGYLLPSFLAAASALCVFCCSALLQGCCSLQRFQRSSANTFRLFWVCSSV